MELVRFENYGITISPEALLIRPLAVLWKRDKSVGKAKALQEIGYIYFTYDPASNYRMGIPDEDDRKEEILRDLGLPRTWKPDNDVQKAVDYYINMPHMNTEEINTLDSFMSLLIKIRDQCKNIDYTASDDPIKAMKDSIGLIKQVPEVVESLSKTKKLILASIEEEGRKRGKTMKKIGEDGFGNFV